MSQSFAPAGPTARKVIARRARATAVRREAAGLTGNRVMGVWKAGAGLGQQSKTIKHSRNERKSGNGESVLQKPSSDPSFPPLRPPEAFPMAEEISKAYQPGDVETQWYARWLAAGCFRGDEHGTKPSYSIVIPPPNVTGILHLGHVLNNTIQDILARRARMLGKEVLWLPGTDHAGIATQNQVEKALKKEGAIKHRNDLGREKLVEKIW